MEKLMTLGIVLSAVDKFSEPFEKINEGFKNLSKSANSIDTTVANSKIDKLSESAEKLNNKLRESASKVAIVSTKFYVLGKAITSTFSPMINTK